MTDIVYVARTVGSWLMTSVVDLIDSYCRVSTLPYFSSYDCLPLKMPWLTALL